MSSSLSHIKSSQNSLQGPVSKTVQQVFSDMLELEVQFSDEQCLSNTSQVITSRISLGGSTPGYFQIFVPIEVSYRFAENLLHLSREEIDTDPTLPGDAIGEIANMAAGSLKNSLPNTANNCTLGVPETKTMLTKEIPAASSEMLRTYLSSEKTTFMVDFTIKEI